MSHTFLRLALVVALLLAVSALPVYMADFVPDSATDTHATEAGDALPDVPLKVSRGLADPPAHPSESQRRIETPERLESPLRQLVVVSGPVPQSATSALGRLAARTVAPLDSTAATPLHLRHCVFLC